MPIRSQNHELREILEQLYLATLSRLDPRTLTLAALTKVEPPSVPPAILAIGKAALGMADAAVHWLATAGLEPSTGLVISAESGTTTHRSLDSVTGDHPIPGSRSQSAAEAVAKFVANLAPATPVEIFLSGGTSSLIALPLNGGDSTNLGSVFSRLHSLGLSIHEMNAARRELTKWSNGRLAEALGNRSCRVWVISDVADNDLRTIGSGPLVGPDGPLAPHHIVADRNNISNAVALAAEQHGIGIKIHNGALIGDVAQASKRIIDELIGQDLQNRPDNKGIELNVWTGETTLQLPENHGTGGRSQHLAMTMARHLSELGTSMTGTAILCGSTDGRDGPTDVAAAVVTEDTWAQMAGLPNGPESYLKRMDSRPALGSVSALIITGSTGTNLGDLVIAARWN